MNLKGEEMNNIFKICCVTNIVLEPFITNQLQNLFVNLNVNISFVSPERYFQIDDKKANEIVADSEITILWINLENKCPNLLLEESNTYISNNLIQYTSWLLNKLISLSKNKIICFTYEDYFSKISKTLGNIILFNAFTDYVNLKLYQIFSEKIIFVDLKRIIALTGIDDSYSDKYRYRWRSPYSQKLVYNAANEIVKQYYIEKGISKKCIIIDCDNVLWGGSVSEDGLEGIQLGGDTGQGAFYRDFQNFLMHLYNHGVVLAVCSKNDYSDVINVFRKHSNMVLKEENIAIFCANWDKKSDNIKYISNTLKIDLEQIVFIDDSPFEILDVSTNLPNLQTIHFEQKTIYDNLSCLNLRQYYDRDSIRHRTQTYQTNAQRSELRKNINSNDEFLFQLGTVVEIKSSDPNDYFRIAELSQRVNRCTNGKRYTLKALQSDVTGGNFELYSVYVADKFSDLGLVGAIGIKNDRLVFAALSCRALDRKVENEMINFIKGKHEICNIDFVCTQKNISFFNLLVKEFGETKICKQTEILSRG